MEGLEISVPVIEETNRKLDLLIEILRPPQKSYLLGAEHMASMLAEVLRIGQWLRSGAAQGAQCDVAEQLERYRVLLEELRALLPNLHAQLLTERSRLEAERTHVEAAAAWARSARR